MKKKLLSFLLALSMLAGLLGGCVKEETAGKEPENPNITPSGADSQQQEAQPVTRGEWIAMLAGTFSLGEAKADMPYFSDVDAGSEIFDYVQSSVEWGILEKTGGAFSPQEPITRGTVAETAAYAAGYGVGIDDETGAITSAFDAQGAIAYALEHSIIAADDDLDGNMTYSQCLSALEAARTAYVSAPPGEEKMEVVPSSSLVDLTSMGGRVAIADGQLTIAEGAAVEEGADGSQTAVVETGAGTVEVRVGSVVVMPGTALDPAGVAYKVSAIAEEGNGVILHTVAPELGDLYDELHINTTVSADPADIIWADGVSAVPLDGGAPGEYRITLLSSAAQAVPLENIIDHSFSFGNGAEKVWTDHNSDSLGTTVGAQALENSNFVYEETPSIEDFNGGIDPWTADLAVTNKYSSGYKITGNITISSIDVTPQIEFNKIWGIPYGVKNASVTLNSNVTSTLTMEGNLSEEIWLASVPIPIGPTGLSVSVDLYLYATASGMLEVRAALSPVAKVEYAGGDFKQTVSCTADTRAEMAIEMNFGANLKLSLRALGLTVVDAGVKVGATVTANAYVGGNCVVSREDTTVKSVYQQSMNLEADLYCPIVSVSVNGLGMGKNWDIITRENTRHVELVRESWVFWEETVLEENDEVVSTETEEGDEALAGASDESRLDFDTYMVSLAEDTWQINVTQSSGQVLWYTDNPVVAVVDENGLVTPLGNGTAVITAVLADDPSVYVKCVVYVYAEEEHDWEFLPTSHVVAA